MRKLSDGHWAQRDVSRIKHSKIAPVFGTPINKRQQESRAFFRTFGLRNKYRFT
jgi:hypothetical protein